MVRTNVVKLTVIDGAAYRQKLTSGGSGIVILRADSAQPGIASISKKTGEAVPTDNTPADKFPPEAFAEAMELTAGLPYKKQGGVKFSGGKVSADKTADAEAPKEAEVVVDSGEYKKIVDAYTDKSGKLSYSLLNRDMIKFAHSSSKARALIDEGASVDKIRLYTVGTKFRAVTGNKDLTDAQVKKIIELLDEVSPKGVFRELNDELRAKLKAAKKK